MHAVANDVEASAKPYLYIQLATQDDFDQEEEDILPELQLVPINSEQCTLSSLDVFLSTAIHD